MLRRLLIAVFVISLFTAFSGTAFSDIRPDLPIQTKERVKQTADMYPDLRTGEVYFGDPSVSPRTGTITPASGAVEVPESNFEQHLGCFLVVPFSTAGALGVFGQADDDGDFFVTLFNTEATEPFHITEALRLTIWVDNMPVEGQTLVAKIWEDDNGVPGAEVASETYTFTADDEAYYAGQGYAGYVRVYFAAPVLLTGSSYFFGHGTGGTGGASTGLDFYVDLSGNIPNTTLVYDAGTDTFVDAAGAFSVSDLNFLHYIQLCNVYSNCYMDELADFAGYLPFPVVTSWTDPGVLSGVANRYSPLNDTLVRVIVWFAPGYGPTYAGTNETNSYEIAVLPDDGFGVPDHTATPLWSQTVGPGLANIFPTTLDNAANGFWEPQVFFPGVVIRGPHHVIVRWNSANPADGGAIIFGNFEAGGSELVDDTPPWVPAGIGLRYDFWSTFCMDEFQVCQNQKLYAVDPADWQGALFMGWNNPYFGGANSNTRAKAHSVAGTPGNKVETYRFQVVDETPWGDPPGFNGYPELNVYVWEDAGGEPGSVLWTDVVSTPTFWPGWNELVIPDVITFNDFWVGYDLVEPADTSSAPYYIYIPIERGSPNINSGATVWYVPFAPDGWINAGLFWGEGSANSLEEVEFCSIPVSVWPCAAPGAEWPTGQGTFQRQGHANVALGDVQCDLTRIWSYTDGDHGIDGETAASVRSGPAILDGKVVMPFYNDVKVFKLDDATLLHTFDGSTGSAAFGTQIYSIPTIVTVDTGTSPDVGPIDLLFINGGNNGYVYCYDWNTYGHLFDYISAATVKQTRWGNFMVLNDGAGTDVLYYSEDQARVYALDVQASITAGTGVLYAGWSGAWSFSGFAATTTRTGTTNGTDLIYYGVNDPGFDGDLVALNAFTGTVNWSLASVSGLKGADEYGLAFSDEGFPGGIAYEGPGDSDPARLYAVSALGVGGVFYAIDAGTGDALLWTTTSSPLDAGTPVVDAARVYCPFVYRGAQSNLYDAGNIIAFNKITGNPVWAFLGDGGLGDDRMYGDIFMTCERAPGEDDGPDDLIFGFNEGGYLLGINSVTGEEAFQRRVDEVALDTFALNLGLSGAIKQDTIAFANWWGGLYVLAKTGVDRPRLKIVTDGLRSGVEFGSSLDTTIYFDEPAITNTGCTPLDVTVTVHDTTNGTQVWAPSQASVDPSALAASNTIADMLVGNETSSIKNVIGGLDPVSPFAEGTRADPRVVSTRVPGNSAAMATPPYITQATFNYTLNPGDTVLFEVHVDKTQLIRGIYKFFYRVASDDPDHFLNDPTLIPQINMTLIYGCPLAYYQLDFGVGGANYQVVTNTSYLADGDAYVDPLYDPALDGNYLSHGIYIDEEGTEYYQGGFAYGVSQHRIAMYTQDWTSCETCPLDQMDAVYASMQPDKNWFDGECSPGVNSSVVLPEYTLNGFDYFPFDAEGVYSTFIDSVEIWLINEGTDSVAWDWSEVRYDGTDGFDNDSTFGTITNSVTIGITDAPTGFGLEYLNSMTLQVLWVNERNGGTIDNMSIWHFADMDIGGDTVQFAGDINAAWAFPDGHVPGEGVALGHIKLPIADGYDGMYNALSLAGVSGEPGAGFWGDSTYWDSAYFYSSTGYAAGLTGLPASAGDGEVHWTFDAERDYGPNDQYKFGIVLFRLGDLPNAALKTDPDIVGLATVANQLAGFSRGDVNGDKVVDIADIVYIANHVNASGPGGIPFAHLTDVNASGVTDGVDVDYLIQYYFYGGAAPVGDWTI